MKATIKLYKISRCGVYKQNSQLPVFLGISELLQELSTWAIGKTLSETDIFRNPNNEGFCTYLADIRSYKASYLLVMWNQVPYTNAGVLSLPNTSKVGSIKKADTNAVKDNSIPGYPTFFWFLPKQNTFATICFNTTTNGRYDMEQYLKQFMRIYSSHVVKSIDKSQKGMTIEGYSKNQNDRKQPVYRKHPVFLSRPYPLSTNIENIAKKAYKIKKNHKKGNG